MPGDLGEGMPPLGMPENLGPEEAEPNWRPPIAPRQYKEIKLTKEQEKVFKRQATAIGRILRARAFEGNQQAFDDYINKYYLGRWTIWENRALLPNYRNVLRTSFRQTKGGAVYDHLNSLVLVFAKTVVRGDYNPAVQINALLAVGELNRAESSGNAQASPWPQALAMLLEVVNDAKLSDAMHAAAMVGIQRHAALGISDNNVRRALAGAMLKIVAAEPPTGPSAMGKQWIVGQALDTLGFLGSPGEGNAVFKAMIKIVADPRFSDRTRAIAADDLGRLNYAGATGVDAAAEAAKVARFLLDAVNEQTRVNTEASQPVSHRRIKQLLNASLSALAGSGNGSKGIMSLASQAEKKVLLDELHQTVKAQSDQLNARNSQDKDIVPIIEELTRGLDAWLKKQSGGGEPKKEGE